MVAAARRRAVTVDEEVYWCHPRFLGRELRPPAAVEVRNATVTAYHLLRSGQRRAIRGAVYDGQGALVRQSLRHSPPHARQFRAIDPAFLSTVGSPRRKISGRWLYGGHWMNHFGHFIMETLPAVGVGHSGFSGLMFHRFIFGDTVLPWQKDLLRLAQWDRADVEIIRGPATEVVVDTLHVKNRPVVLGWTIAPRALAVWQAVARSAQEEWMEKGEEVDRLYLSRMRLAKDDRRTVNDEYLDLEMEERGFTVIHPQEYPVAQQIGLVSRARIIAGPAGSNLLLSAFARPGTRLIEVGNRRSAVRGQPMQHALSTVAELEHAFIPYRGGPEGRDVPETLRLIDLLLKS